MSVSIFSFGKKRRSRRSRKSMKSMKRNGKKPSAKVMRMCRKCKVKTTKKVGKRRVYRPESLLVKLCKKKMRKMKKRTMKKRKSRFGSSCSAMSTTMKSMGFGKRRRSRKVRKSRKVKKSVSRSAAMKAFKKFYSLHCKPSLRRSRFRFGNTQEEVMPFAKSKFGMYSPVMNRPNGSMMGKYSGMMPKGSTAGGMMRFGGGNPHTNMMMGYDFCPEGGLLGAGTGLYATPCTTSTGVATPSSSGMTAGNAFGRKKRKSTKRKTTKRKSTKRKGSKKSKRKSTKRKSTKRKTTKRKGSKKNGTKRKYTKKPKMTMVDASTSTAMVAKEKVEFGRRRRRVVRRVRPVRRVTKY